MENEKRERRAKVLYGILIGLVAAILIVSISIGITAGVWNSVDKKLYAKYGFEKYEADSRGDRIYFLNTPGADAMIIESDGHFAMVDAAEDSQNPRGFASLELKGYEEYVLSELKRIAGDENGKVTLDFVVGTHAHSDHLGGFDTVILDEDVTVKKAYVKKYNPDIINLIERNTWDNQEVFDEMIAACNKRGVEVVHDIPTEIFKLGDLNITLLNGDYKTDVVHMGENANSLVTLVERNGVKALLTGDLNNFYGDETEVAKEVGKIDLLKVGHHGHIGSTNFSFVKKIRPELSIVTQYEKKVYFMVREALRDVKCPIYGAGDHNGIVAEFKDYGFELYTGLSD